MEFPTGIKPIGEMTRAELVEEIITNQRAQLDEMKNAKLKHLVADFRIAEATKRIHKEAGLSVANGIFGPVTMEDGSEED